MTSYAVAILMERYNVPSELINQVKQLYSNPRFYISQNGTKSKVFAKPVSDDFNRYQIQRNQMGQPVALPNDTPVMFEGIAQRDPVVGHDHSMGTGNGGLH